MAQVDWIPVRCHLCGQDKPRIVVRDRVRREGRTYEFTIVQCGNCGLIYTHPRGRGAIFGNLQGGGARRDAGVANRPIYTAGTQQIVRALGGTGIQTSGPVRCLDIGCAYGDFLEFGRSLGWHMEGLEVVPDLAQRAGGRGVPVHVGELPHPDLPPASYTLITMWDVIEHLDDPLAYLRAAWELLIPGGFLFFHTGNAQFQIPKARLLGTVFPARGPYLIPYQHLYHFTPRTATALVQAAAYEVLGVFGCGTLHYQQIWKRAGLGAYNRLAKAVAAVGGPLRTSAMGVLARRPLP